MKKRRSEVLALVVCGCMALGLSACGSGDAGGERARKEEDPNHFVLGDYELDYKGARIMADYDGDDALVLTLDYTNNSDNAESFLWSINEKAFQDGVQLETAVVFVSEDSFETLTDTQGKEIQPGKTIEVQTAFELANLEQEVEVTFEELLSGSKKKGLTIDPSALERDTSNISEETDASETEDALSDSSDETGDTEEGTEVDDPEATAISIAEETEAENTETEAPAENESAGVPAEPFVQYGDGITTKDTLVSAYDTYDKLSLDDSLSFSYEDLVALVGVNGAPQMDNADWSAEKQMYCWYGEGTNVILSMVLKKADDGSISKSSIAITGDF